MLIIKQKPKKILDFVKDNTSLLLLRILVEEYKLKNKNIHIFYQGQVKNNKPYG